MTYKRTSYQPLVDLVEKVDSDNPKARLVGFILAAVGSALFASKAILIKLAYASAGSEGAVIEPLSLLAIRMGLAVPIYALILWWALKGRRKQSATKDTPKLAKHHYLSAGLMGMLGYYVASFMDFNGLVYITAQLERLILFTYPAFVMILGAMFFGHKVKPMGVLSMVIAYCGLGLVFARGSIASGDQVVLGALLVFGAAFSFGLFQLLAARKIQTLGSTIFTCCAMLAAGAGILIHFTVDMLISGDFSVLHQSLPIWLYGGSIALFSTLLPSFMVNIALGRIGAQAVAVLGMISPLVTILMAVTLLNEPFGWIDAVGTLITIFGIGLFTWFSKKTS